jgi:hypothetical protein
MPTFAQHAAARSLVDRSRLGDQNAMAILDRMKLNAQAGDPTAIEASKAVLEYIKRNPFVEESSFGDEDDLAYLGILKGHIEYQSMLPQILPPLIEAAEKTGADAAVVILADGPFLDDAAICAIGSALTDSLREIFFVGAMQPNDSDAYLEAHPTETAETLLKTGAIVNQARLLQQVRLPNSPIAPFDADAHWENT